MKSLFILFFAGVLPLSAQVPSFYNSGDIAVVNEIIDNNGLKWPKADPADGSYVPDEWIGVGWSEEETDNRVIILDILNQSLTGDLDVTKLSELQHLLCSSWIEIQNSNSNDGQPENVVMNIDYLNRLTSINASGCSKLLNLDCTFNQLTSIDVSKCADLAYLYCSANHLDKLNVEDMTCLKDLYCNNNNLTALYLKGCINLERLYCSDNNLSSLDVSGLTNLLWLFCSGNSMTSLDMVGLSNLQRLYCSDNSFTSIDISDLTGLEILSCEVNKLSSLDVSGLSNLLALNCAYNDFTSLDVSGCADLLQLSCSYCKLASIDLPETSSLTLLNCMENDLTALDLSGQTSLRNLYCNNNSLSELDLSGLTNLENLFCDYNSLTALDVTGLPDLLNISCLYNELTFLDLSENNSLAWFDGIGQKRSLTLTGDDNIFTANIVFGDGATFDDTALSYENGLLTSTSDEARAFGFTSPTGRPDMALTGTITATYETENGTANDPHARFCNPCAPLKSFVQNGRLHVSGLLTGMPWSVYHFSGALVYQDTATGQEANLNLPAHGLYIITSGAQSAKVVY